MGRHDATALSLGVVFLAGLFGGCSVAFAQADTENPAARMPWGAPNLQGVWGSRTLIPLERPEDFPGAESLISNPTADPATRRPSLVVDPPAGRLPSMTPSGQQRAAATGQGLRLATSWAAFSPQDRCILGRNSGPPVTPSPYADDVHVLQTPDHVALVTEMIHDARIVPLDGRPPLPPSIRQWSGDSRGHWEGDTLVIETTNFDARRSWRNSTEDMRLIERLSRVDSESLLYTFTVDDPDTWTRPWTAEIPMRITGRIVYEYPCHEENVSLPSMLVSARAVEDAGDAFLDEEVVALQLHYDIGIGSADLTPLVRIYGGGRVVVHFPAYMPAAGDYETNIDPDELRGLLRAVWQFDPANMVTRIGEQEALERLADDRGDRSGGFLDWSDEATTSLEVQLPNGARQSLVWTGLQRHARRFPRIPELRRLAEAERRLVDLSNTAASAAANPQ